MNARFFQLISRLLVISMLALPFQSVQAGMVGTDQMLAASQSAQTDREKVRDFLSRSDVQAKMQAMGLSSDTAKQRVAALTDEEVQKIAGKIDTLPAGAMSGWAVAGVIFVILLIWYFVVYNK
jgi:hypothetical protein